MTRNRASAKAAGTAMETAVAHYLAATVDDRIERRARTGAKDTGDIAGVRLRGAEIVLEVKNCARLDLPYWMREAHVEAGNADALVGVIVHKRHGVGITTPDGVGQQWVTMTLADLAAILTGTREDL